MCDCLFTGGDRERMTANHESYLLMAGTQHDMEDWVKSIRRVIWGPFGGGECIFKSWKNGEVDQTCSSFPPANMTIISYFQKAKC